MFVAYYRVSTQRQGQSGLGLEAQRAAAEAYAKGRGPIIAEFVEVETGTKKRERPKIKEALALTEAEGATLLIAKLDRLARNVVFVMTLKDSGVPFVCADMPEANGLTIGMMAVLAQYEAEMISTRTKAALDARRRRGLPLGTPANLTAEARRKGSNARKEIAQTHKANRQAAELAGLYKAQGHSLRAIAKRLNQNGYQTRSGKSFAAESVRRLLGANHTISCGQG